MELLLIRHGLPARIERADGQAADPPLTDVGWMQSRALSRYLSTERIDALYVSPMQRARQTAQPLADRLAVEPVVLDAVAEFDRLEPSYIPIEDLKAMQRSGQSDRWQRMLAENLSDERKAWRLDVVDAVEAVIGRHRGHNVAIVCHGGVINAYVTHILRIESPIVFEPAYTSINRVAAAGSGERTVLTLNEAPWLRDLSTPTSARP